MDQNMVRVVDAVNRFPGIYTISSCGGHVHITNTSQTPMGTWYVNFALESGNPLGPASLDVIGTLLEEHDLWPWVSLKVWLDGGCNFELRSHVIPPDEVAVILEVICDDLLL